MRFDEVWLLIGLRLLLGFTEFLDQTHWPALKTAVESTTCTGVDDITELFRRKIEELVEVDAAIGEFAELCEGTSVWLSWMY